MDTEITIINPAERPYCARLWRMWAGAYGSARAYVWARSEDSAFETFAEWLDDHAPGMLVSHAEFGELLASAIAEHAPEFVRESSDATIAAFRAEHAICGAIDSRLAERVLDLAERDLTAIGHTTLAHGAHIVSHEWGLDDVAPDSAEYHAVLADSLAIILEESIDDIGAALGDVRDLEAAYIEAEDGDEQAIDVRLQVYEDGRYCVRSGDASYDQDHRGFWGASSVAAEDSDADLSQLARDLVAQALDHCAQYAT